VVSALDRVAGNVGEVSQEWGTAEQAGEADEPLGGAGQTEAPPRMPQCRTEGRTGMPSQGNAMNPDVVSLLRDPGTREALELVTGPDGAALVASTSGRRFPLRDGIPDFLDPEDLTGSNGRYQRLYDRMAGFYDASIGVVATSIPAVLRRRPTPQAAPGASR
jgi:uncharacterized protein YbaR (Trm112 family)